MGDSSFGRKGIFRLQINNLQSYNQTHNMFVHNHYIGDSPQGDNTGSPCCWIYIRLDLTSQYPSNPFKSHYNRPGISYFSKINFLLCLSDILSDILLLIGNLLQHR